MTIKMVQTLVVTPGTNEQSGVNTKQFGLGTTLSREFREFASFSRAILFIDCITVAGTNPTLDTSLQVQDPISQKWQGVATFAQITTGTGAGTIPAQTILIDGENYRAQFIVGGTATPTLTISFAAVLGCEESII